MNHDESWWIMMNHDESWWIMMMMMMMMMILMLMTDLRSDRSLDWSIDHEGSWMCWHGMAKTPVQLGRRHGTVQGACSPIFFTLFNLCLVSIPKFQSLRNYPYTYNIPNRPTRNVLNSTPDLGPLMSHATECHRITSRNQVFYLVWSSEKWTKRNKTWNQQWSNWMFPTHVSNLVENLLKLIT